MNDRDSDLYMGCSESLEVIGWYWDEGRGVWVVHHTTVPDLTDDERARLRAQEETFEDDCE